MQYSCAVDYYSAIKRKDVLIQAMFTSWTDLENMILSVKKKKPDTESHICMDEGSEDQRGQVTHSK